MPDPLPISFRHARALARSLAALGLSHVVISPGSRNTPLVLAFHEIRSVKKIVVLDERVAAFTALGISRATGTPSAVLCTSGTAAANYYPAVIEARQSGIPLLLLTADRSNLDRKNGAPQSMIQTGMFNSYTVFDYDAALPDSDESIRRLEYLAWQAMDAAINGGGPVHLNLPYDKPLEPRHEDLTDTADVPTTTRWVHRPKTEQIESNDVPQSVLSARRPLIVAGPVLGASFDLERWIKNLSGTGIPLLASHTSGLTHSELKEELVRGYHRLLRSPDSRRELRPDLIIRLGHFPVIKAVELFLEEHADVTEWSVMPSGISGSPHHPSGFRLDGIPSRELLERLASNMDSGWRAAWSAPQPSAKNDRNDILTDGAVHRIVLDNIPHGDNVVVSNSLPVRDMETFGQHWHSDGHRIFSARGVSGIDGVTSQAIGVCVGSDRDTVLITGDLAFLHDSNALSNSATLANARLLVVVINNGGGKIFKSLPIGEFDDLYDLYFGTPQTTDIQNLCKAYGVSHHKVTNPTELLMQMEALPGHRGIVVVECITDPEASQAERLLL